MKIVMAGPSGSGKTTLAKALAKETGLPFIENSASMVMLPEDRQYLMEAHCYTPKGQINVINSSHRSPSFGVDFQEAILRARRQVLTSHTDCILDRSPIDALVFYLNQCVHNQTTEHTESFIKAVVHTLIEGGVTHIIRIPLLNPERHIEDDDSRCSNWYFQMKVDSLFDLALDLCQLYADDHALVLKYKPIVRQISTWNWETRFKEATEFIKLYRH